MVMDIDIPCVWSGTLTGAAVHLSYWSSLAESPFETPSRS